MCWSILSYLQINKSLKHIMSTMSLWHTLFVSESWCQVYMFGFLCVVWDLFSCCHLFKVSFSWLLFGGRWFSRRLRLKQLQRLWFAELLSHMCNWCLVGYNIGNRVCCCLAFHNIGFCSLVTQSSRNARLFQHLVFMCLFLCHTGLIWND